VNTAYVVTAAVLLLLALWRTLQARRAWAGRPVVASVHRDVGSGVRGDRQDS
jgi:hypothetical protein